jgi:hypothetical protein
MQLSGKINGKEEEKIESISKSQFAYMALNGTQLKI